jgi:citrate/tricarballylate utilization protein
VQLSDLLKEGERVLTICNACRYCEGYCAVFPAMERLTSFPERDLHYLANLCHNCRECFYACPFTTPHEFDVDIPRTLTQIREASYKTYAWPTWLRGFSSALAWLTITCGTGFSLWMPPGGTLYAVMPHRTMVMIFATLSVLVLLPILLGARRFSNANQLSTHALLQAARDALMLKYMSSGGTGCTYPDETHSNTRRWLHHATFYGFVLCFASTCVAAIYHYAFGWVAPYSYESLPVILGTLGGVGLVFGPLGLLALSIRAQATNWFDAEFTLLLFLTGATGLLTLAVRETASLGRILVIHLAFVAGLFLTLAYGKFVHGVYRFLALLRYSLDRR